jgi:periplasmic protein TonB
VEPVTSVLLERAREPGGLRNTVTVSVLVHAAAATLVVLAPAMWGARSAETPRTTMTITLGGGAPGPRSGGVNPIGGRPVQTTEPANPKKPEALRAPAEKAPEMTMPAPKTKKPTAPQPQPKTAPDEARGKTLARGAELGWGTAVAETGGKGQGWGLSTGGTGGTGSYLEISGNFCCPDYISTILARIERQWQGRQGVRADAMVKFTILRSGRITDIELERGTGYTMLDLAAQRSLYLTGQLPPLPDAFTDDHLTVHLLFEYKR